VLVYAHRKDAPEHEPIGAWLEDAVNQNAPFGLSTHALSGMLRVVTHPRVFDPPTPVETGLEFVEALRARRGGARTAPLGDLRRLVRDDVRHRQFDFRRLLRGARDRVGKRMDHDRQRLRALSGATLAASSLLRQALPAYGPPERLLVWVCCSFWWRLGAVRHQGVDFCAGDGIRYPYVGIPPGVSTKHKA